MAFRNKIINNLTRLLNVTLFAFSAPKLDDRLIKRLKTSHLICVHIFSFK